MDLYLEELKRKYAGAGGFKSAVREVRESLGLRPDTFRSWKGLAFFLERNSNKLNSEALCENEFSFFVSERAKVIFALTQLDGENRMNLLGITKEHYSSLAKAKKWRNEILHVIHPDKCSHQYASEAVDEVTRVYRRMKKHGK